MNRLPKGMVKAIIAWRRSTASTGKIAADHGFSQRQLQGALQRHNPSRLAQRRTRGRGVISPELDAIGVRVFRDMRARKGSLHGVARNRGLKMSRAVAGLGRALKDKNQVRPKSKNKRRREIIPKTTRMALIKDYGNRVSLRELSRTYGIDSLRIKRLFKDVGIKRKR